MTMRMIKQAVVASLWPALVLTGALCSSCSLMLDWDPNKQPCNTDASLPECDDGYSCASGLCVGDRTIPRGDDCAKDKQCSEYPAGVCTPDPSICRVKCTVYYGSSECEAGYYCRPSSTTEGTATTRGSCVQSECPTPGAATGCAPKQFCFKVTSSANACLAPCGKPTATITTSALGSCTTTGYTCQPIGVSPAVALACIKQSKPAASLGGTCDLGGSTCDATGACIGSSLGGTGTSATCRTLCDPAATTAATDCHGSACQPVTASGSTFGFCP